VVLKVDPGAAVRGVASTAGERIVNHMVESPSRSTRLSRPRRCSSSSPAATGDPASIAISRREPACAADADLFDETGERPLDDDLAQQSPLAKRPTSPLDLAAVAATSSLRERAFGTRLVSAVAHVAASRTLPGHRAARLRCVKNPSLRQTPCGIRTTVLQAVDGAVRYANHAAEVPPYPHRLRVVPSFCRLQDRCSHLTNFRPICNTVNIS
jgi:hypothetical protein